MTRLTCRFFHTDRNTRAARRFFTNQKSPVIILLLSALVGILAGLLSTLLDLAVNILTTIRLHWVTQEYIGEFSVYLAVILLNCVLTGLSFLMVYHLAPEAKGSGIQEVEGVLDGIRPMRWKRVIPVKFLGGIGAIGGGMVLGREGPSVQMGGGIGQMVCDLFGRDNKEDASTLVAAGSAAGLAAAFNAPLAGIMFVVEEMKPEFHYTMLSIKSVTIGSIMATVVYRLIKGQQSMIDMPVFGHAPLSSLYLFLILGLLFGILGVIFNRLVMLFLDIFERIVNNRSQRFVVIGILFGAAFGLLAVLKPFLSGEGVSYIARIVSDNSSAFWFVELFVIRVLITLICFCSGAPGGVFAPMLVLGTLFGCAFGSLSSELFNHGELTSGMFAIAGMGALFAATVRAPLTGILLIIETTHNYNLILPLIFTCLGATMMAQALGGKPLYSLLLERTLERTGIRN